MGKQASLVVANEFILINNIIITLPHSHRARSLPHPPQRMSAVIAPPAPPPAPPPGAAADPDATADPGAHPTPRPAPFNLSTVSNLNYLKETTVRFHLALELWPSVDRSSDWWAVQPVGCDAVPVTPGLGAMLRLRRGLAPISPGAQNQGAVVGIRPGLMLHRGPRTARHMLGIFRHTGPERGILVAEKHICGFPGCLSSESLVGRFRLPYGSFAKLG